ncbi:MAG: alpha/beta hydrolase [Actinobacteria bacterium]|nr:alpha/beta hydrolase [Actinomycetota bacterium]
MESRLDVGGGEIVYETIGDGDVVILTPGGRHGRDVPGLRELAGGLAERGLMAVIWDRRNCGAADVGFEGRSESHMWAEDLAALAVALDRGPVLLAGGSAGSRISLLTAVLRPELTRGLALWWVTGGLYGHFGLAAHFSLPMIKAVSDGGMEAVADLPEWAASQQANPGNRDRILTADPEQFRATAIRWLEAFVPDSRNLLPGVPTDSLRGIEAPALIFRSEESDPMHPAATTDALDRVLADSELVAPPWSPREWPAIDAAMHQGSFACWERLAAPIADWAAARRGDGRLSVTE